MSYVRSLHRLVALAALALLGPAACGDTAQPPMPPGGEGTSCAQAVDITAVVAGGGAYSGRATAEGDFEGLCASQKGRIEYLRFDAAPGNYEIAVSGPHDTASTTAVLDVRTGCASSATELGCDPHARFPSTLVGVSKPGGVVLVLSGDWYGKGYEIRIEPASKCATNANCAASYPQTLCATKSGICYAPLDCAAGTADCDADPSDGCETDTTKDAASCGACGATCSGPNANGSTCVASTCVLACDSGYADCDGNLANGCEVYLPGDGAHCGACGNDCMHGGCEASTCTAPPEMLGTSDGMGPNGPIAIDAANVYVAGEVGMNMGGVVSVPKSGGAATPLVNDDCTIDSILVDAGTVYWAGRGCSTVQAAIKSAPVAGGATNVLASDPNSIQSPTGLLADATTLYWYDATNATLLSLPKAGGTPQIVANVGYVQIFALAADATNLYFTAEDLESGTTALYSVPKPGGTPKVLAALPSASSGQLAVSGTDIYVATYATIVRVATSGGPLTPFTSAHLYSTDLSLWQGITSLAIAGGNLYWSEGAAVSNTACPAVGAIWKIPLAGGAAVGLASDEPPGPIAVDASGVYMSATCSGAVALHAEP